MVSIIVGAILGGGFLFVSYKHDLFTYRRDRKAKGCTACWFLVWVALLHIGGVFWYLAAV